MCLFYKKILEKFNLIISFLASWQRTGKNFYRTSPLAASERGRNSFGKMENETEI